MKYESKTKMLKSIIWHHWITTLPTLVINWEFCIEEFSPNRAADFNPVGIFPADGSGLVRNTKKNEKLYEVFNFWKNQLVEILVVELDQAL